MKTYIVKRHHFGDREYAPGDQREAAPISVAHLVANGVLVEEAEPVVEAAGQAVQAEAIPAQEPLAAAPVSVDAPAEPVAEPAVEAKAEAVLPNKTEPAAPKNKAEK
jgi:hypothetical protein